MWARLTPGRPPVALFWSFVPLCIIALVIGFAGELAVLGPNITLERGATAGWLIGSSAGLQACGIVLSGPLASYLLGRIGSGRVLAQHSCAASVALRAAAIRPIL